MSTSSKRPTSRIMYPPFEPFIIERREVIGTIEPDPHGSESAIAAAFLMAGQYLAEADIGGPNDIALQFTVYGATFRASVDGIRPPETTNEYGTSLD